MSKELKGMRFTGNKIKFGLIPKDALVEIARVYHIGSLKYDENNWLNEMEYSKMMEPLERHYMLWAMGQTLDPETRLHHLAQVAWNAIGLLTYELRGLGVDDRTKLPINSDFSWAEGPAKELDIGMSAQEMEELRTKYADLRQAHKVASEGPKSEPETSKTKPATESRAQLLGDSKEIAKWLNPPVVDPGCSRTDCISKLIIRPSLG